MHKTILLIFSALAVFTFTNYDIIAVQTPAAVPAIPAIESTDKDNSIVTEEHFEDSVRGLYREISLASHNLSYEVFRLGLLGYYSLLYEGALNGKELFTIIDFEKPSTEKRFYTIDLKNKRLKYHTYVAHGRNTGQNIAVDFSNIPHSNKSSLGFSVTGETYVGSKGYSLRLDGKEKSYNDKIRSRAVVIHAAEYATEGWIKRYGRLGRSQGCPALPPDISREVIDSIKDRTMIFTYYPDETYLRASPYLQLEAVLAKLNQTFLPLPGKHSAS
jgi:hypothetical protein